MKLEPEQIQDLPWATLDDLLDAKEDVAALGRCFVEIVDVEGEARMRHIAPGRLGHVRPVRVHVPEHREAER